MFLIICLQNRDGNLANGAIANLVDIVGGSLAHIPGLPMNVSVDISVSYVSTVKLHVSQIFPLRSSFLLDKYVPRFCLVIGIFQYL